MTTAAVKYPDVSVQLTGEDEGSWTILNRVSAALKAAGHSDDEFWAAAEVCSCYKAVMDLVRATVRTT